MAVGFADRAADMPGRLLKQVFVIVEVMISAQAQGLQRIHE